MEEFADRTRLTFIFEYSGAHLLLRPFKRRIQDTVHKGAVQVVTNINNLLESETKLTPSR